MFPCRRVCAVGALVLLLSGCSAMRPSANPESAQKVRLSASRFESRPQNLGSSAKFRKPLRTGQWVATLATSKSNPNDVTLQVTKVVGVSGDAVTLEMEQYAASNEGKRTVIQQTIRNFPVNAQTAYSSDEAANLVKDIEIQRIRIMDDEGRVTEMPQLPLGLGQTGGELLKTTVATGDVHRESCGTTRFQASSCYVVPFESKVLWMTERGTTYAHSAVPILGFVRSESTDHEMELVGFGDKGAQVLIR